jgi:hypothetical protein
MQFRYRCLLFTENILLKLFYNILPRCMCNFSFKRIPEDDTNTNRNMLEQSFVT